MAKGLLIGIALGAAAVVLFSGASSSVLPFGLLALACPLMMVFMMGGHGHGHGRGHSDTRDASASEEAPAESR